MLGAVTFPFTMAGKVLAPCDARPAEEEIDADRGLEQVQAGTEPPGALPTTFRLGPPDRHLP